MCIVCIDLIRGLVTPKEALGNLGEIMDEISEDHAKKVVQLISLKSQQHEEEQREKEEEEEEETS